MHTLRVAVVGAGSIARRYHLPSLTRLVSEGISLELVALCDVDTQRAHEMGRRFGFAQVFSDYRAMVDAIAPDAVWCLVPIPATRQVAGYMLEQGIPTLMEKPPGRNSRETRELLEIAATRGTLNQVAFNRRHAPLLVRMKRLLGERGDLGAASCQFYRHRRGEPDFAFGTGLHGLDALRFLGSDEVVEVHTRLGPRASALITLVYQGGALGTMEMLPLVGVQSERYTAHAADRTVVVDGVIPWLTAFPGSLRCFDGTELTLLIDNAAEDAPPEVVGGFFGECAHFVDCLLHGQVPTPDLTTSLRSVEIAEAVNQGRSVVFD